MSYLVTFRGGGGGGSTTITYGNRQWPCEFHVKSSAEALYVWMVIFVRIKIALKVFNVVFGVKGQHLREEIVMERDVLYGCLYLLLSGTVCIVWSVWLSVWLFVLAAVWHGLSGCLYFLLSGTVCIVWSVWLSVLPAVWHGLNVTVCMAVCTSCCLARSVWMSVLPAVWHGLYGTVCLAVCTSCCLARFVWLSVLPAVWHGLAFGMSSSATALLAER